MIFYINIHKKSEITDKIQFQQDSSDHGDIWTTAIYIITIKGKQTKSVKNPDFVTIGQNKNSECE